MSAAEIKPCACGATPQQDSTPHLHDRGARRMPYVILCGRCGRQTTFCRTQGVAVALWNRGALLLGPTS